MTERSRMSTRATLAGAGAFLCCAQRLVDRPSRWRPGIATVGAPGTIGRVQQEAPQVEAATAKTSTAQEQTETSALTRTSSTLTTSRSDTGRCSFDRAPALTPD